MKTVKWQNIQDDDLKEKEVTKALQQFSCVGVPCKKSWGAWCNRLKWIFPTVKKVASGEKGFVSFTAQGEDTIMIMHNEDVLFKNMDYDGWEHPCSSNATKFFVKLA